MRIGEFITLVNTTKDTVRHYEELNLLTPVKNNKIKNYSQKEIVDFHVIIELKDYGLSLKEIQIIFKLKQAFECGNKELVTHVFNQLTGHLNALQLEEEEIRNRRIKLENEINKLKQFL